MANKKDVKKQTKKTIADSSKKSAKQPTKNTTKKVVNKEQEVIMHNEWQNLGLLAQLIFSMAVLFFGGVCIFHGDFLIPVEKFLGLTILTMAYNNHFTYKRKGMTVVYTVLGIAILFIAFMGW